MISAEDIIKFEKISYKLKNLINEHEYKLKIAKQYNINESIKLEELILNILYELNE
jgi:hypothetical protein